MKDGRVLSANEERLAMIRPDHSEAWRIPGHYHHQMNWSSDGRHILALSSKVVEIDKKNVRLDVLMKIDLDGKIIGSIDSRQIFEQLKGTLKLVPLTWSPKLKTPAQFEVTHFNSLYEIPSFKKGAQPYSKDLEPGNYIGGVFEMGAFVLSSDFTKVKSYISFPSSFVNSIHDVQVLEDGGILFFNNFLKPHGEFPGPSSAIEVMRKGDVVETLFAASPPEAFYSPRTGAVQVLGPDLILFSHYVQGFFFWDTKKKKILRSGLLDDSLFDRGIRSLQQIKSEDLTEFLKAWQ